MAGYLAGACITGQTGRLLAYTTYGTIKTICDFHQARIMYMWKRILNVKLS